MAVPKNDDLRVWKCLVQLGRIGTPELIPVRHDHRETVQLELNHLLQLGPDVEPVAVAVDRRDWGEGFELYQEIEPPHVPAVQDVIDFPKDFEHLGPQQPMGVRDDAESHFSSEPVT